MANRRETDEFPSSSIGANDRTTNSTAGNINDRSRDNNPRSREEQNHSTGRTEVSRESRREENPFSFKHFLKKEVAPSYGVTGARPKVYRPPPRTSPPEEAEIRQKEPVYPRNPTELPDFVQDHLVVEQCYSDGEASARGQASAPTPPLVSELENLPDFAINSAERRHRATRRDGANATERREVPRDLPFDLTGGLERRNIAKTRPPDNPSSRDSSAYPRPNRLAVRRAEGSTTNPRPFPLDLPSPLGDSAVSDDPPLAMNSPSEDRAGVGKSLPDFLNDGPIRGRVAAGNTEADAASGMPEKSDSGLFLENEYLREELRIARRQIADKTRMVDMLEEELTARRAVNAEETGHWERAIERAEVDLKRSTKRATSAESAVTLLKQEIKALTAEIATLRTENRQLRSIAGASCPDYDAPGTENKMKKLSEDLRAAATSAEISLRQLMSGVSNLKIMASTLENIDRIEDRTKDFLPDFEEDNTAGPAL